MSPYLTAAFVPLVVSFVATRAMLKLAVRFDALDRPDGKRKLQKRPIPVWGGVAVFIAMLVGGATIGLLPTDDAAPRIRLLAGLFCSSTLIFTLGFFDDRYDLPGKFKLLLQVVAVLPVLGAGLWCDRIGILGYVVSLGWLGIPFTMLWLVGAINALNLLDGMDGSASVVGATAAGAVAVIAASMGWSDVSYMAVVLAGAILGFLFYNLPSASIYLGDAGSTNIGLIVGLLALRGAIDSTGVLRITVPLVLLTVPILDCSAAILRRKIAGRRFDHADRGHLHHRLLRRGMNTWQALAVIGVLCGISASAAVLSNYFKNDPLAWLTSIALVVALAQFRYFGHHESALIRRTLSATYSGLATKLSRWEQRCRRQAMRNLPRWTFEEAWDALTARLAERRIERMELCLWQNDQLVLSRRRQLTDADVVVRNEWRLTMNWGPRGAARCEICLIGRVRTHAESRRLSEIVGVIQLYGLHWLRHSDATVFASSQELVPPSLKVAEPAQRAA